MMKRIFSLFALLCSFALLRLPPIAYAAEPPATNTINLTIDENHDGLPDQLVAAVTPILALDQEANAANMDATQRQAAATVAIDELVVRLPYAPETRALQAQARTIQEQLNRVEDVTEQAQLRATLQDLATKMAQDPNWVTTTNALRTLLTHESASNNTTPDNSTLSQRVFLPVVQQGAASTGVQAAATTPAKPNFDKLKRGDIMLINTGDQVLSQLYAMNYAHVGTFESSQQVYESNPDGVKLKDWTPWRATGKHVAFATDNKRSSAAVQEALTWAEKRWGTDGRTPYNYNFVNKWDLTKLYCSQLVWKIHLYKGVDLDSNNIGYQTWLAARWGFAVSLFAIPAVAPDEIALSPNVTIYDEGYNK